MSRTVWTVTFSGPSAAYIRGRGTREALIDLRRRVPMWSAGSRAWVVLPHTARDLIALADSMGITVNVVDEVTE